MASWDLEISSHQKDAVVVSHDVKTIKYFFKKVQMEPALKLLINLVPNLEVAGVIVFLGFTRYQRAAGSRV